MVTEIFYILFCQFIFGCKTDRHTHTIVNAGVPLANLSRFDGISSWARLTERQETVQIRVEKVCTRIKGGGLADCAMKIKSTAFRLVFKFNNGNALSIGESSFNQRL